MLEKSLKSDLLQQHFESKVTPEGARSGVTNTTNTRPVSGEQQQHDPTLMKKHMDMYNDMIKIQPPRHTGEHSITEITEHQAFGMKYCICI